MMDTSGAFFDGFASKFDTFYDGKRNRAMRWVDQQFRSDMFVRFAMTFDFLGDLTGKRVLDIGCGSGPYIVEALERGALHVTGIDPAPRMLDLANRRVTLLGMQEKVAFMEGYFPRTCPPESFDFSIVMGVMDYVEDPLNFLRTLRAVVSRGAVLSFPSTHWFRTPFRKVRYLIRRFPVNFYNHKQIERLMLEAGVEQYSVTKIPGAGMDYVVCLSR